VLDARNIYPDLSLATLYGSNTMIPELVKAHQKLDKAVEAAYGRTFEDDSQRVAFLFELYQNMARSCLLRGRINYGLDAKITTKGDGVIWRKR